MACEKPTSYFLGIEQFNHNNRVIQTLISDNNERITQEKAILLEQAKFFKCLYTSRREELAAHPEAHTVRNYLENCKIPKLTEDEKLVLEEPIVLEEIIEAVRSLQNRKAAGTDGLPIEIYKFLLHKIGPILFKLLRNIITEISKEKKMHLSARRGIITLIEKVGRDSRYLKNWHPISLLNCDYKILAKILATRLDIVLPKLINTMQSGFMKGRNIEENVIKLTNVMVYCRNKRIMAVIISFNF